MFETTVISTEREEPINKVDNGNRKYRVYNYMKEHTTVLVACVSAFVAVVSFLVNFAVDQYSNAYLRYWMIDTVYKMDHDTGLFHRFILTVLYIGVIIFIHQIMTKTASAFGYYHKFLSALRWNYKGKKKIRRRIKHQVRRVVRQNRRLAKIDHDHVGSALFSEIESLKNQQQRIDSEIREIGCLKFTCDVWIGINVLISALIMFAIVWFVVYLVQFNNTGKGGVGPVIFSVLMVLCEFILYFFPVCCARKADKRKEFGIEELQKEIEQANHYSFPIVWLFEVEIKELLSDLKIRQLLVAVLLIFAVLIGTYISAGKNSAMRMKEFPICADETGTYAVVYNNGESLVLKSVEISENQIEIDVRKQKVVSATDVSYQIHTFETVVVTGKDGG